VYPYYFFVDVAILGECGNIPDTSFAGMLLINFVKNFDASKNSRSTAWRFGEKCTIRSPVCSA